MFVYRCALTTCFSFVLLACSGSKPSAKAPDGVDGENSTDAGERTTAAADKANGGAEAASDGDEDGMSIPSKCAKPGGVCVPPRKFVERLCNDTYLDTTLWLFSSEAPYTHAYLTRETEAWNAAGGASDTSEKLAFDEEVLILRERNADFGGMQVSGAGGGYDALRWDGSCVSLAKEEVTLNKPPQPKAAHIDWRYIGDATQEKLRENERITDTYRERRQECRGAVSGSVSKKCVTLDGKLTEVIVEYIREGGSVPKPERLD